MAWRRPGDKPLSEPLMANLPTHICVARPQWVKCDFSLIPLFWHCLIVSHIIFVYNSNITVTILKSVWPSDTIWWHRSGSTLAQIMACCPMAPSHYLMLPDVHIYVLCVWAFLHRHWCNPLNTRVRKHHWRDGYVSAEIRICWDNQAHTMATDALDLWFTRSSAAMVLNLQYDRSWSTIFKYLHHLSVDKP